MPTSKSNIQTINPHNGKMLDTYSTHDTDTISAKIALSKDTSNIWKKTSLSDRAYIVREIAESILTRKDELAKLCSLEMGKPISQSIAEIKKSANALMFYAQHAPQWLESKRAEHIEQEAYVTYAPLGTLLAIMPWNFPYWQVLRAMGPALMAGNTMLLKHASNVTGCALAIEEAVQSTSAPKGLFQTLIIPGSKMSEIIAHPDIHAIAFTGSSEIGKIIASQAGAHLKKHVLELGGSDPYLVLEDADIDLAAQKCVQSRLNNAGQSCIAAKRWIVHTSVYDAFKDKATQLMKSYTYGDPLDANHKMGPLVDIKARDHLHEQVKTAVQHGGKLILGGEIPSQEGAYYPPSIIENIQIQNPIFNEELFGPVALLFSFDTLEEAFKIANATPYGLGGAVFSKDEEKAYEIASKHLDTGSIFINNMVVSHPALPFGGIKDSGYGRELSALALYEFSNIKTISK